MKFLCSVLTKIINMTTNITLKLFIPVHEKCRVIRLTFCGHASVQELCLGSSIMDMLHHRGHLSPCRKVSLISKECIFHSFVIMIANKNWKKTVARCRRIFAYFYQIFLLKFSCNKSCFVGYFTISSFHFRVAAYLTQIAICSLFSTSL